MVDRGFTLFTTISFYIDMIQGETIHGRWFYQEIWRISGIFEL